MHGSNADRGRQGRKQLAYLIVAASRHPVVASHTGPRACHDFARYLTDSEALALAGTGGLIGLWPFFHRGRGDGAIMRLGDEKIVDIEVIPTGNILIDRALGVGGFPRGRVVEVYGPESSGKTTLTLTVIAQAQKRGGLAALCA